MNAVLQDSPDDPERMLRAALALAEEYGLPVFPCRVRDEVIDGRRYKAKSPLTPHGFKDATMNLDKIRSQWLAHPDALVGVPTGAVSGLFVIDVDPRGLEWYRENAPRLAAGRIHKTQRGHHLLYQTCGMGCSSSALADGVDTRGDGGYVIWWPASGLGVVGNLEDVGELPGWLAEAIGEGGNLRKDRVLADPVAVAPDRSRDLMSRVARDVRAGMADYEIVTKHRGHPHARDQTNPERAVQRCIDKAREGRPLAQVVQPLALRTAAEIAAQYVQASWLLRPFLEREALILMFGALGSLKSFLALHWSLSSAEAGFGVVYLSAEGRGLWARLRAWAIHHYPNDHWSVVLARLPFRALEHPVNLSADDVVTWLQAQMQESGIKPALVVVDTISRNSDGLVERSNEDAVSYLNRLDRDIRSALKCAVLFIHHPGHTETHRARGPYALMANTDANFLIERTDPQQLAIKVTSGRMKDCEAPAPTEFRAVVIDVGEVDDKGVAITSVAFERNTIAAQPSTPKPGGKNQERALVALREWVRTHPDASHITSPDIAALLKSQGVARQRRPEVLNYLVLARILTPSIGGYAVDAGML